MQQWQPRTGSLLAPQQRINVTELAFEWRGLREALEGDVRSDASVTAGRSLATADLATVLLFASHHAEYPRNPMARPTLIEPDAEALIAESVARLSVQDARHTENAALLNPTDRAFDFRSGLPTAGPGYMPSKLGHLVVGSIIGSAPVR